jgi:hypothetical protein
MTQLKNKQHISNLESIENLLYISRANRITTTNEDGTSSSVLEEPLTTLPPKVKNVLTSCKAYLKEVVKEKQEIIDDLVTLFQETRLVDGSLVDKDKLKDDEEYAKKVNREINAFVFGSDELKDFDNTKTLVKYNTIYLDLGLGEDYGDNDVFLLINIDQKDRFDISYVPTDLLNTVIYLV